MSTMWNVAAKDLRQLAKDRSALVMLFVVPLVLIGLLGSVVGDAFDSSSKLSATLPVVDRDGGPSAHALLRALRHTPGLKVQVGGDETALKRAVRNGDRVGLLIVPSGFSRSVGQRTRSQVSYYAVAGNGSAEAQLARAAVTQAVDRLAFQVQTERAVMAAQHSGSGHANSAEARQIALQASRHLAQAPPVSVLSVNSTGRKVNAADNTVPGYALMFALFGIMAGARSFLEEKESGTLKRLLIAPIPPYALLGGKLLSQFIQSLVQITILFTLGALLFKINLGSSLPALALLIVGTSFAATGLGLILVSIVKSERQVRPITMLIVLSFSAIGGSWWPISLEPQWMQTLSKVTINGWAMNGFNGLMVFDKTFSQVLPDIAALFAYGIVCLLIARRTFRFSET